MVSEIIFVPKIISDTVVADQKKKKAHRKPASLWERVNGGQTTVFSGSHSENRGLSPIARSGAAFPVQIPDSRAFRLIVSALTLF